jgi:hypothetical protein
MTDHDTKALYSPQHDEEFEVGTVGLDEDADPSTSYRRLRGPQRALLLVSMLVLAALIMGGGIRTAVRGGGEGDGTEMPSTPPFTDAVVELNGDGGQCKFTVEFQTMSGDIPYSGSSTGAKMAFFVNGDWTDDMLLFAKVGNPGSGATDGEVATKDFAITDWPEKMQITAGGNDALGYQRIDFLLPNGVRVPIARPEGIHDLSYPDNPDAPQSKFWVDGNEDAPVSNEFPVPALHCATEHCKFTVEFETMSGGIEWSGTNTGAKMSFFINDDWTDEMVLFDKVGSPGAGATDGEIATKEFDIKDWPEKVQIIAGGNDALGYARIDFVLESGIRVPIAYPAPGTDLTYPTDENPDVPSAKFWVDGDQAAPVSNTFPVPQFSKCGNNDATPPKAAPPAPAPCGPSQGYGRLDIASADVAKKDLGDGGPLILGGIGMVGGKPLDLEITAKDGYKGKLAKNGKTADGFYGIINLDVCTKGDFTFQFKKDGEPFTMPEFSISFFDLDKGKEKEEILDVNAYASFKTAAEPDYTLTKTADSAHMVAGSHGTGEDNPKDPMQLTALQKSRSASFSYKDTSEFQVSMEVHCPDSTKQGNKKKKGGRNFMYSFSSSLACPAA